MMPNAQRCKVTSVWRDDDEVQAAGPGENLRIRISGIDEDQVRSCWMCAAAVVAAVRMTCAGASMAGRRAPDCGVMDGLAGVECVRCAVGVVCVLAL